MDVLTPEQRRRCMQANKGKGTGPELALGRLMWRSGIRYRKHPKDVPGTPDFCIRKYRLAVFVDGEFWHGRNWEQRREKLKKNREFWIAKIERNIRRDREVNRLLRSRGWKVLRFWETEVRREPGLCLSEILGYLSQFTSMAAPRYIPSDLVDYPEADVEEDAMAAEPPAGYGEVLHSTDE